MSKNKKKQKRVKSKRRADSGNKVISEKKPVVEKLAIVEEKSPVVEQISVGEAAPDVEEKSPVVETAPDVKEKLAIVEQVTVEEEKPVGEADLLEERLSRLRNIFDSRVVKQREGDGTVADKEQVKEAEDVVEKKDAVETTEEPVQEDIGEAEDKALDALPLEASETEKSLASIQENNNEMVELLLLNKDILQAQKNEIERLEAELEEKTALLKEQQDQFKLYQDSNTQKRTEESLLFGEQNKVMKEVLFTEIQEKLLEFVAIYRQPKVVDLLGPDEEETDGE